MKKEYKNQIFQFLLSHELGIDNFEIKEKQLISFSHIGAREGVVISYKPAPEYLFCFLEDNDSFGHFIPASVDFQPKLSLRTLTDDSIFFQDAFDLFRLWLERDIADFIKNTSEVDLWASYQRAALANNITTIDYEDVTGFTHREKESIKIALAELRLLITERYAENDIHREVINHQIRYLTDRVEVLNKADWKGILTNTIISICIALSLDSQKGAELLQLVIQVFQFAPGLHN
ncbi:hypothetical protein [Mucilaginibacter sp. UR6-11]|uniref:hypothetical protein n=1 Tax=Mucilaginibacter sp. UR6-11 TaxID=1435644 RepID=UPI001E314059|nr:hypothetical protein [Mucilaginibacter sp. UR6-11]MCC8424949.1 hypothetical protein [Mucilaginibacter sp. UR6-11]